MIFTSKKKLLKTIKELSALVCKQSSDLDIYTKAIEEMNSNFPFDLGQVVYDVQLRTDKGRYTTSKKGNASREHSLINEVIVDEKNYFKLVKRYQDKDVFIHKGEATKQLNLVCKS